ncbi:uncharacterized protein LOC133900977 [Phragmites australis]|uniref:uncharacterized protein LOC133900977 n=1 Tax=Phragmites australis TaxID=29695 RepID=UPI002D78095A|nr:uncharacterized protein LOC133900977 [Phragmites australis]
MGFLETVQWWEEWQLRVLVLASLFLHCFLFFSAYLRKRRIPPWLRFLIWLAYLGSDAVAIYALAALFNRHKKQEWVSTHRSSSSMQVLWAPILLLHLGGQDGITSYNIEDNELWRRHVLSAVSQVIVVMYVLWKSPPGDGEIFAAMILVNVGIVKCLLKPWDLKRVSINSLVDSSSSEDNGEISSLHEYIRAATQYFQAGHGGQPSHSSEGNKVEFEKPYDLFVDLAPPYSHRLSCLWHFVRNRDKAHRLLQYGLSVTFDRLYTKESLLHNGSVYKFKLRDYISYIRSLAAGSIISAIVSFHGSNKEAYDRTDVNITYALLYFTAVLEIVIPYVMYFNRCYEWFGERRWPDQVAQYNLIGYLARNKKHSWFRKLAALLVCKDYIDHLWWCTRPSKSSRDITELVHGYVTKGWTDHHIKDVATYRAFNDNRGKWTIGREQCTINLELSIRRPFDESVLIWHLATDFCFYQTSQSPSIADGRRCREMSNYMAYLLFVNPEMLMTGARRSLLKAAYRKLKDMLKEYTPLDEKELAHTIIQRVKDTEGSGIVYDAWCLANDLMDLHMEDEEKMWRVIQGVWVEMLCFSAGRCRGYLHAKSLGNGGEYLSYVWLLLSFMGMETLAERMQRTELCEGATTAGPTWASPTLAGDENV